LNSRDLTTSPSRELLFDQRGPAIPEDLRGGDDPIKIFSLDRFLVIPQQFGGADLFLFPFKGVLLRHKDMRPGTDPATLESLF
jgi:hypothetical protein